MLSPSSRGLSEPPTHTLWRGLTVWRMATEFHTCTVPHPAKSCQHRASSLCTFEGVVTWWWQEVIFHVLLNSMTCQGGQGGPPPHKCEGSPIVASYRHLPPSLSLPASLFPSCPVTALHTVWYARPDDGALLGCHCMRTSALGALSHWFTSPAAVDPHHLPYRWSGSTGYQRGRWKLGGGELSRGYVHRG
jgi:hypothetical protein